MDEQRSIYLQIVMMLLQEEFLPTDNSTPPPGRPHYAHLI